MQPLGYHTPITQPLVPLGQHRFLMPSNSVFSHWDYERFPVDVNQRDFNQRSRTQPDATFDRKIPELVSNSISSGVPPELATISPAPSASNHLSIPGQPAFTSEFLHTAADSGSLQQQSLERSPTLPTISLKPLGHHDLLVRSAKPRSDFISKGLEDRSDKSIAATANRSQIQTTAEDIKPIDATSSRVTELKQERNATNHSIPNDAAHSDFQQSTSPDLSSHALSQTHQSATPESISSEEPSTSTQTSSAQASAVSPFLDPGQHSEEISAHPNDTASIQRKSNASLAQKKSDSDTVSSAPDNSERPVHPLAAPTPSEQSERSQPSHLHSEIPYTQSRSKDDSDEFRDSTASTHQESPGTPRSTFNPIQPKSEVHQTTSHSPNTPLESANPSLQQTAPSPLSENATLQAALDLQPTAPFSVANPNGTHSSPSRNSHTHQDKIQPKPTSSKSAPDRDLPEIASAAALQPLGQMRPLGTASHNLLSTQSINVHASPEAEAPNPDTGSIQQKPSAIHSSDTPDIPTAWSDLSELVTGRSSSKNPDRSEESSTSHDFISRYVSPDEVSSISENHHLDSSMPRSVSSSKQPTGSLRSPTGKPDHQISPIDEQQFEMLAQRLYRLMQQRLEIEQEFEQNWVSGYPLWFSSVVTNHKSTSQQSSPLQTLPDSTIFKQTVKQHHSEALISRKLQQLTGEIYVLLRWRIAVEQERFG
jgi:hypothetical protein